MNEDDDEEDAYYSLDEDGASESELEMQHSYPEREQETASREMERRRVLEAAGLVVSPPATRDKEDDSKGSGLGFHLCAYAASDTVVEEHADDDHIHRDVPFAPALSAVMRSKSGSGSGSVGLLDSPGGRRRPAPAVPQRGLTHLSTKNLPPIPRIDVLQTDMSSDVLFRSFGTATTGADKEHESPNEEGMVGTAHFKTRSDGCIIHPDDAFERYEMFKKIQASQGHSPLFPPHVLATPASASASRMSMSSFDTGSLAPTSPPRSPATSVTPSLRERERENGGGHGANESRTSQFLSFLGRHTRASTPDNAERERKLVISGPILHAPMPSHAPVPPLIGGEVCGLTREGSPVFGSSWASLVDRSALEGIPKEERKRQEAIFELIFTEADYVRDVQLLVEVRGFLIELRKGSDVCGTKYELTRTIVAFLFPFNRGTG